MPTAPYPRATGPQREPIDPTFAAVAAIDLHDAGMLFEPHDTLRSIPLRPHNALPDQDNNVATPIDPRDANEHPQPPDASQAQKDI